MRPGGRYSPPVSTENVEIIREQYELFNRRELARAAESWDEDAEWSPARGPGGLEAASYRGQEAVMRWFEEVAGLWADFEIGHITLRDLPSGVLAVAHLRGTSSGVEIDASLAHVWELRDGKIVRVTAYLSEKAALTAVGAD